jgi:hypothetical protein
VAKPEAAGSGEAARSNSVLGSTQTAVSHKTHQGGPVRLMPIQRAHHTRFPAAPAAQRKREIDGYCPGQYDGRYEFHDRIDACKRADGSH